MNGTDRMKNNQGGMATTSGTIVSNLRYMLMGAIFALLVNNLMISMNASHRHPDFIPPDFFSSSSGNVEERPEMTSSSSSGEGRRLQTNDDQNVQRLRNPRILFGIFSSDSDFDETHRMWHRQLIGIWNDERVCSLDEFRSSNNISFRQKCEVLYTFVVGAHSDPNVPLERLEDTDTADNPIEFEGKIQSLAKDINLPDVTLLNIRENMNQGKSQTWLYFASKIAKQFENAATPIDYVVKFDADSMLKLYDFLDFAYNRLPPAPYNKNIYAGSLRDKLNWYKNGSTLNHPYGERNRYESHFNRDFDGVHLYIAGQCYLMSTDLAASVAKEARFAKVRMAEGGYLEGVEDHDVSTMAFRDVSPVSVIAISVSQRFWEHPVKGAPRFLKIKERERARVNRKPYQGELLKYL